MSGSFQQFKQRVNRWIPDKNKAQFFLIFVGISALFWLLTRFSNVYTAPIKFPLRYTNLPEGIIVDQAPQEVSLWIQASGFQLIWYSLLEKTLDMDLQNAELDENQGIVSLLPLRAYLEKQLFDNAVITLIQPSSLTFPFDRLQQKKVPVVLTDKVQFKTGYNYRYLPVLEPDSITLYGMESQLQKITFISTLPLKKKRLSADIYERIPLDIPASLEDVSQDWVQVQAKTAKFTELTFELPIRIDNLPDNLTIKIFPKVLRMTGLVPIRQVDSIAANDFVVEVDFRESEYGQKRSLAVRLRKSPPLVRSPRWEPQEVEYLIRK